MKLNFTSEKSFKKLNKHFSMDRWKLRVSLLELLPKYRYT
ncbi:hypothetical protein LEP1GSC075_0603 [Leptospira interrogans str. Kito]|nr:hypothetical protein LEP1GSC069_1441 [Leptospira interrogans serovar Canicola str. Fiocruz LV133]EMF33492.1 hypothetical protein LEP1GSC201_2427 [Leptospira interrogans serovar Pomona str. Fox 32256]EMI68078.1 hypothetical protein LEP1GSC200_0341 [Leptospira interrogans serovar Pomona str. CSL10083]EMK17883.1 hypothetical protein LEP1GSC075_0603 [Leptospira interrogans str. Kito]EMN73836.1 hypothetical protein LEP1GSC100_3907 [Leptospira interrogans serovar Bataviae str. UI 08561]EMN93078.1